jgi:arylsulfatase A-like enzyme/tetratricopeptide (TPR) repeat protein
MRRASSAILTLALLAAVLIFQPGCRRENEVPRLKKNADINLLLITIDSWRADRLGAFGLGGEARTPNLDRLAESGIAFKNCYAPAPLTLPSHCTLMTGREPLAHRVRNNGGDVLPAAEQTLAEVMKSHNFATYALVSSYALHSKFGLKQGFDAYDDSLHLGQIINTLNTAIPADMVFLRFRSWLEQRSAPKFFAWVNFSDPQAPYQPPPEYAPAEESDPYGGELALVDHFIGEMMNVLETKKLAGRTVVVLAGSHGESLHEHGEFGHGLFGYEETLRVPLILYSPAVIAKKQIVDHRVRLLDVMPTLLELFRMEIPGGVQGESLWPLLSPPQENQETERPVYFESFYGFEEMGLAPLTGLISSHYKYISLPEAELYDLQADPAEMHNLASQEKVLAEKMRGMLQAYQDSHGGGKPAEMKGAQVLDPKNAIESLDQVLKAGQMIFPDKLAEAEKELQAISRNREGRKWPLLYDTLYFLYQKKNDPARMEDTLKQAVREYPDLSRFGITLAQAYMNAGRLAEAEKICLEEVARDPLLSQAQILLGKICQEKGEAGPALSHLERALELEPLNFSLQAEYASQLAELGQKGKSLEIVENILKSRSLTTDSESTALKADLAGILMKIGETEMAQTLLLDIVANGRGTSMVWAQVGLGYLNKGNPEKALEALEKALSLDPNNALALSGMGTFFLTLYRAQKQKENLDNALAYYSRATEVSPQMVAAWNGLGVASRYAGHREKAIACWKQALQIDPGFTNTYFNLGITLLESGRRQEALLYLSTCLEKYSDRLSPGEKQQLDTLISEARQ